MVKQIICYGFGVGRRKNAEGSQCPLAKLEFGRRINSLPNWNSGTLDTRTGST